MVSCVYDHLRDMSRRNEKETKTQNGYSEKEKHKTRFYWKMNFFSIPSNPQKDYSDENTNSMFDGNTTVQDEGNIQYNFRRIIVEKDEKKIKTKGEKKRKPAFFKLAKTT